MNTNYPSIISVDHYEPPYQTYIPYPDYASTSKLEAIDYNPWSTNTHNLLSVPSADHMPIASSTANASLETLAASPSVHVSQINSTTTISATHHHHHIHQHLYPANESANWLASSEYPSPNTYRHYAYPNNNFYEQAQWPSATPTLPIKFESSYYESSHHLDEPLIDSKEEPSEAPSYVKCPEQQLSWLKPQLTPVPPKNPSNGKSHSPR